jgi:NAD(P)-dependent dehydrogenase (short-subunit alcohol dehydrogenase family)
VVANVTNSTQVEQAVAAAVETFGRLDYAFNNAGVAGKPGRTAEVTEEDWLRVIDINLTGVWRCMRAELPVMLAQGSGAIVNCSSVLGLVALANNAAYVASKHGVIGLTRAAALEYATSGIRINAISPGFVETPMLGLSAVSPEAARERFVALEPMGRLGAPEEIARAVVWLCSDAASFVTGTSLVVDGGWISGYRM